MNKEKQTSDVLYLTAKIAKLEQELREAKQKAQLCDRTSIQAQALENFSLRKVIEAMPGNVFWKAKDGRYLGVNRNIAQIFGYSSPQDFVGKRNADILPADYAAALDKLDEDSMNSPEGKFLEEQGLDIYGNPAIYFSQKIPLRDINNEIIGLIGISIDITQQKKIEKELQIAKEKAEASNRAKSQFLAVVNHELRTPLTGIVGLVDILKQTNISKEERQNVIYNLDHCAQYILTLVNDVLDFTKFKAGHNHIHLTPTNLSKLVQETYSILGSLAQHKELKLIYQDNPELPLFMTDESMLRQVLVNIVNNAIKFTDQGEINITTKVINKTAERVNLEICISDTGCGMPNDKLGIIFEPFQQLEDTYIRRSSRSGTGLGLAIVKQLAELLNIHITVQSEINKGSQFIFRGEFNIYEQTAITPDNTFIASKLKNKQIHALLIEDDYIVQHIHKKMLIDLDCTVDIASHGQQAIDMLDKHDIVFVDIGLSDMTGFEVIQKIREKHGHQLPLIALTGYTGPEEQLACLRAGANEVAMKPISIEKLKNLLSTYGMQ